MVFAVFRRKFQRFLSHVAHRSSTISSSQPSQQSFLVNPYPAGYYGSQSQHLAVQVIFQKPEILKGRIPKSKQVKF